MPYGFTEKGVEEIRKEILDLSEEELVEYVAKLKKEIAEKKSELYEVRNELETSNDDFIELEDKYEKEFHRCDECVMPNCKSMFLVLELESVISTFKREHKVV